MNSMIELTKENTTKEKEFLLFLNNEANYPLKRNTFKFLIVSTSSNESTMRNFFGGILENMLVYICNNHYLFIFQNKDKLELKNFIELINEDLGERTYVLEGFSISKDNKEYLMQTLKIVMEEYHLNKMYSSTADLVLAINDKREEISILKKAILDKYLNDSEFIRLIETLFKNNLNVSKTAVDSYMHRNTINNKLSNFERDTNITIQNFKDAVAVYELLK